MVAKVKRSRMTMYNNECAEEWSYNGQMYRRCVKMTNPSGSNGDEWCKLVTPTSDGKDWEVCDNNFDADSLRENIGVGQRLEIVTMT